VSVFRWSSGARAEQGSLKQVAQRHPQDRSSAISAPTAPPETASHDLRRLFWAAFWLGFGLGGFFDGIILRQLLQWHHLLSNVFPEETVADLRFQVLADGVFHVATYAFTALGLWLLRTARRALPASGARQRVIAAGLLGFGVWHIADAILFHWVLRLHRIRMDADNLLHWDILSLVPFGLVPAAVGYWLLPQPPTEGPPRGGRAAALSLALAALVTGPVALLPPAGVPDDRTPVVFRPGMDFSAFRRRAAEAAGGRPVWSDAGGGVWLIALEPGAHPGTLYRHGALLVLNGVELGPRLRGDRRPKGTPLAQGCHGSPEGCSGAENGMLVVETIARSVALTLSGLRLDARPPPLRERAFTHHRGVLRHIALLYQVEKTVRGKEASLRLAARCEHAAPIIAALRPWLEVQLSRIPQKSQLASPWSAPLPLDRIRRRF
jgi:uncharacterized membrane protein